MKQANKRGAHEGLLFAVDTEVDVANKLDENVVHEVSYQTQSNQDRLSVVLGMYKNV